jgi:hypothetical protein
MLNYQTVISNAINSLAKQIVLTVELDWILNSFAVSPIQQVIVSYCFSVSHISIPTIDTNYFSTSLILISTIVKSQELTIDTN